MAAYKQRIQQIIMNSSKQLPYIIKEDVTILNLNTCFIKKASYSKLSSILKELVPNMISNKLNLCNLASLCYKLGIKYDSEECLDFVYSIISFIKKEYPQIELVQNGLQNCEEIDMRPLTNLMRMEKQTMTIYVNSVLLECLKNLGYVESQMFTIVDYTRNLKNVIPADLLKDLPIMNKRTIEYYKAIKRMITC